MKSQTTTLVREVFTSMCNKSLGMVQDEIQMFISNRTHKIKTVKPRGKRNKTFTKKFPLI